MNSKTTKQAVSANTTKAASAAGNKRSRRASVAGGIDHDAARRAEPVGRKRRKPFVL